MYNFGFGFKVPGLKVCNYGLGFKVSDLGV